MSDHVKHIIKLFDNFANWRINSEHKLNFRSWASETAEPVKYLPQSRTNYRFLSHSSKFNTFFEQLWCAGTALVFRNLSRDLKEIETSNWAKYPHKLHFDGENISASSLRLEKGKWPLKLCNPFFWDWTEENIRNVKRCVRGRHIGHIGHIGHHEISSDTCGTTWTPIFIYAPVFENVVFLGPSVQLSKTGAKAYLRQFETAFWDGLPVKYDVCRETMHHDQESVHVFYVDSKKSRWALCPTIHTGSLPPPPR